MILITGASGRIGTHLTADLAAHGLRLRLLDRRRPPQPPSPGTEVIEADLRDLEAVESAAAGAEAIIHLAGITQEAMFSELVDHNILGTHHVLEAARRRGVHRVVLASSHHVVGLLPPGEEPDRLAPDSFYAVSKTAMEALGRLYAAKTAVQVVAIRIGSFRDRPTEPRHRATWLSPRDATALFHAAATHPLPEPFVLAYGTSANSLAWWPRTGWTSLGYRPTDNADDHPTPGDLPDRWTGGTFADADLPA